MPPRRGDLETRRNLMGSKYFYSRPRVGGDTVIRFSKAVPSAFLLTPPRGGRQQLEAVLGGLIVISTPRPRNRGRTHRRGTPQAETGV